MGSKEVGKIPWQIAPLELTGQLVEGENLIEIEVFASPRNMLGPLHRRERNEEGTGSWSFRTEGLMWTDEYVIAKWGLKKARVLTWK